MGPITPHLGDKFFNHSKNCVIHDLDYPDKSNDYVH